MLAGRRLSRCGVVRAVSEKTFGAGEGKYKVLEAELLRLWVHCAFLREEQANLHKSSGLSLLFFFIIMQSKAHTLSKSPSKIPQRCAESSSEIRCRLFVEPVSAYEDGPPPAHRRILQQDRIKNRDNCKGA